MRDVVERTFGAWKKRFPILTHALDYSINTQCDLVFSLAVLHNFAIDHGNVASDDFFNLSATDLAEGNNQYSINDRDEAVLAEAINLTASDKRILRDWRDGIAEAMWTQYQQVIQDRRQRRHA